MRRRSHPETLRDAATGYAHQGIPILPDILPHPPGELAGVPVCTCRRRDCPAMPLHPPRRLDQHPDPGTAGPVARWWSANPDAAIATVAGAAFDVIDLHTAAPTDTILQWLSDQGHPVGPAISAGPGRLQLLAAPDSYQPDRYDSAVTAILYLPAGALLLLPPSRLADGQTIHWLRPLHPGADLPDGNQLFWALVGLPVNRQLPDPEVYAFPASYQQLRHSVIR